MYKFLIVFFFFFVTSATAQIFPREDSKLNYRLIGFSFPEQKHVKKYTVEIAEGNYNNEDKFRQQIITSFSSDKNRIIGEAPSFGKAYTWQVVCDGRNKKSSGLHHFSTGLIANVDTTHNRLRVFKKAEQYKDAYVFLDGTGVLYDMNGNPVWFLPENASMINIDSHFRDLKLSPNGTITLIIGDNHEGQKIYEIDYNGNILWHGPNNGKVSGDSIEHYHHEFTRLANGHYMVLGSELIPCIIPASKDSNIIFCYGKKTVKGNKITKGDRVMRMEFGTLIEYDENGNIDWSWKSSDYFKTSDIDYRQRQKLIIYMDVHDNGFYFDEKDSVIYISFRNLNRILKIKYPEGTVLAAYGQQYKPGFKVTGNNLFCGQHSVFEQDGYLYLFNNNTCNLGTCNPCEVPTIVKLYELNSSEDGLEKVWEYKCVVDGIGDSDKQANYNFSAYGNVLVLPDSSLFVSMSSPGYSKVFIVNPDKKILWSAIPEKWNADQKKWEAIYEYRASIIYRREDLERLIWNAEIKR